MSHIASREPEAASEGRDFRLTDIAGQVVNVLGA